MALNYYTRNSSLAVAASYKKMIDLLENYETKLRLCQEDKENIRKELEEIKAKPLDGDVDKMRGLTTLCLNIPLLVIKRQYVKYIETYGVPEDGYFLPDLLADFE